MNQTIGQLGQEKQTATLEKKGVIQRPSKETKSFSDILKECREYLLILAQICLSAISQFEIKQKWTSL